MVWPLILAGVALLTSGIGIGQYIDHDDTNNIYVPPNGNVYTGGNSSSGGGLLAGAGGLAVGALAIYMLSKR